MKKFSQIALWAFLIITILLGFIWQFFPLKDARQRIYALPLNGPGFEGRDLPLSPLEENFFKNVNVLKRLYVVDNQIFFVTALDGTRNRHVVHDPYYCFRGGGWEIVSEKQIPLPRGHGNVVEITKGNEKKTAIYWFSDGKKQFTSPWTYWWEATLRRLTLGHSGPEPLLIMVQPLGDVTEVDWEKVLKTLQPVLWL